MTIEFNDQIVLDAYRQGLFPMAESADSQNIQWIQPHQRGQLSITELHISRSLKKEMRQKKFSIRINHAFEHVIKACAEPTDDRQDTWINPLIRDLFCDLHHKGHAHSVECWEGDALVGGLYGLSMGQVFCGESMFSRRSNASKIALVHLAARLWRGGFKILDTQFTNEHLEQFGVYEIPHAEYLQSLQRLVDQPADFILEGLTEDVLIKDYLTHRQNLLRR